MRYLLTIFYSASIAGILLLISPCICKADEWHIETLDPEVIGDSPSYPCIDVDNEGIPHISYVSFPWENDEVRYAFWNGTDWVVSTVANNLGPLFGTNIKLDSQDRPKISFNSDFFTYLADFDGDNWTFEMVNPILYTAQYSWNSLSLDSQDQAHLSLAAFDETQPFQLCVVYAYNQGGEWINEIVENNVGTLNSICIDSNDNPNIAYITDITHQLKYAHWSGSVWQISTVDPSITYYSLISLCMDLQDKPHISYFKNDNLYYTYWDGSEWVIQMVDDAIEALYGSSLAIDSQGMPHISYHYDYPVGNLKYAYFDGNTWQLQVVDTVWVVSDWLALDRWDRPYIVYKYYPDYGYGSYLKLAWQGGGLAISLLSFTATPQEDSSVLLNWQVETSEGEQIAGFNLYRREIVTESYSSPLQKQDADWTKVNSSLITGQNPYAYTDSTVEPDKFYEYRLEAVLADESTEILGTACCAPTPPAFAITKVYPNPVTDNLNISITDSVSGQMKIKLYDLSGRLVMEQNYPIESGNCEITVNLESLNLNAGLYTVKLEAPQLSKTSRIVYIPENK